MNIDAPSSPLSTGRAPAIGSLINRQEDFLGVLGRQLAGGDRESAAQSPEDRARSAAEQFVAVALVQPVLERVRESSMAAEPFAPTPAEKQFRSLREAGIAQQVVRAAHFPLVDRLARQMLERLQALADPTLAAPRVGKLPTDSIVEGHAA